MRKNFIILQNVILILIIMNIKVTVYSYAMYKYY